MKVHCQAVHLRVVRVGMYSGRCSHALQGTCSASACVDDTFISLVCVTRHTHSLASVLLSMCCLCCCPQKGKEGVQEQYEQTDDFHERWRVKARDFIARGAWRRQKLAKRVSGLLGVMPCAPLPQYMQC